jgi:DNA anti-recombination protein RmuC
VLCQRADKPAIDLYTRVGGLVVQVAPSNKRKLEKWVKKIKNALTSDSAGVLSLSRLIEDLATKAARKASAKGKTAKGKTAEELGAELLWVVESSGEFAHHEGLVSLATHMTVVRNVTV